MENNKKPNELAELIIEKCSMYVNGYSGSSFMTNTEYPDVIRDNAISLSKLIIIDLINNSTDYNKEYFYEVLKHIK